MKAAPLPLPHPIPPHVEEASGHAENMQKGVCSCALVTEEVEWPQSLVLRKKRGGLADAGGSGAPECREVPPARERSGILSSWVSAKQALHMGLTVQRSSSSKAVWQE